jgi:hypothetical protein
MKAIFFLLAVCIFTCSAQTIYNPGLNVAIKDWLIFKIKDEVVPKIMEEFKEVQIPDQGVTHDHYEVKVYAMEADIVPLTHDQIQIITDEAQNSLTVEIDGFQMAFDGQAYARALFVHAHGEATIDVKLEKIAFTIEPRLKADGDLNQLDYFVDGITIDVKPGDIKFSKLTIGILPSWLLTSITNVIVESATFMYKTFEKSLDNIIVKVLDKFRVNIPDAVAVPNTPFSVSLSFPNVPQMKADRIELPFDGSVFVTETGYSPVSSEKSAMPAFNPEDPNNIQVFFHEYVANTAINSLKSAGSSLRVDNEMLSVFGLSTDILVVKWLSHLFPKLLCTYDKAAEMSLDLAVSPTLNSALQFSPGKLHGEFSPEIKFNVEKELAFTVSFRGILDADVQFEVVDKVSTVRGTLNTLDMADITFVAGTVPSSDLPDIINTFKTMAEGLIINLLNGMLQTGFTIPIIPVIQEAFEIDIEDINVSLAQDHLAASLTVDVAQMDKLFNGLAQ